MEILSLPVAQAAAIGAREAASGRFRNGELAASIIRYQAEN
jgi:hypothetical protein